MRAHAVEGLRAGALGERPAVQALVVAEGEQRAVGEKAHEGDEVTVVGVPSLVVLPRVRVPEVDAVGAGGGDPTAVGRDREGHGGLSVAEPRATVEGEGRHRADDRTARRHLAPSA